MDLLMKPKITFASEEKKLLVSLIGKEKVLEDMRTNKATNHLKTEAWKRITKKYNSHSFVTKRESMQLRRCWEKIKRLARDTQFIESQNGSASSGSLPPSSADYDPQVDDVVQKLKFESLDSEPFVEIKIEPGTDKNDLSGPSQFQEGVQASDLVSVVLTSQDSPPADSDTVMEDTPTRTPLNTKESTPTWQPPTQSGLNNHNSTTTRRHIAPTAAGMRAMKHMNILKDREQQENLYLLRRSILTIEKVQAEENLRHLRQINRIREKMETEKLEHQRTLWKLELDHPS